MRAKVDYKLAAPQDRAAAAEDRRVHFAPPSRGFQLGLAMFDAAAKNQHHGISEQIARSARHLAH